MKIDIFIPVYNEEKILAANLTAVQSFIASNPWFLSHQELSVQMLVIVNGSSDSSWLIAQDLAAKSKGLIAALNYDPAGKGGALFYGFYKSQADIIAYMDIDLSVSLNNLPNLLSPFLDSDTDFVIGSRLLSGSQIERSLFRSFSSYVFSILSRLILRHKIMDCQCGFKAFKRSLFQKVSPYIIDRRWFFDTELVAFAKKLGYIIKEIPVDWKEERYQKRQSKVRVWQEAWSFLSQLVNLRRRLKI